MDWMISPKKRVTSIGVQQYKADLRGETKEEQQDKQATQQEEKNKNTGEKLAEQFTAEFGDVMNLFNGDCEGNWGCVRKALREQVQTQSGGYTDHDLQTALQIASKYGSTEDLVLDHFQNVCGGDWACTRSYFRNQYMSTKETGKPNKNK